MGWVYILRCSDGSYYTGSTKRLDLRLIQYHLGGVRYTSKRLPVNLVYSYEFDSIEEAFLRERQIKRWSRRKKEALIRGDIDALIEFSKSKTTPR